MREACGPHDARGDRTGDRTVNGLIIHLGQSLLGGIGLVWLFFEAYYGLGPSDANRVGFLPFLLLGVLVGSLWFVIDGLFVSGFLKRSITLTSNAIDANITVMFGDLFAQDGCKAISVNEFFDSDVDEKHVASRSLHGAMLTQFWPGNTGNWDDQVSHDLSGIPAENTDRPAPGKTRRYAIGTTALASKNGHDFLCVAVTRTCIQSLEASATSDDLQHAVHGLLSKARTVCSGRPLNIPLLGSGLARTGIKPNIIVDLILLAIFEESRARKITGTIRIVLPKNLRDRIDLTTIQKDWR